MSDTVTVRRARPGDFAEVRRLSIGFTPSAAHVPEDEVRARFLAILADPRYFLAVAEAGGGALAGYLYALDLGPGLRTDFTVGRVDDVYVDPEARRHGVGRALMEAAFAWARANPLPMILDWSASPDAVEFYVRLGFTPDYESDTATFPEFTLDLREDARRPGDW